MSLCYDHGHKAVKLDSSFTPPDLTENGSECALHRRGQAG